MKKLYRIISDTQIEIFPNWIKQGDTIYTNAKAIEIAETTNVWYELVEQERPQFDVSTHYLEMKYRINNNKIEKYYIIKDFPQEEV